MNIREIAERINGKQPDKALRLLEAEANLLKNYFPELKAWQMTPEQIIMKRYSSGINNELTAVQPVIIADFFIENGTPEQKEVAAEYMAAAEENEESMEEETYSITTKGTVGKEKNVKETFVAVNKSVSFEEAEEMIRKTMGLRAVMPDAQDIVDQFLRGEISKASATTMLNELESRIIEGDYGNDTEATFREAANYYAPNLSSVRKTPRKRR